MMAMRDRREVLLRLSCCCVDCWSNRRLTKTPRPLIARSPTTHHQRAVRTRPSTPSRGKERATSIAPDRLLATCRAESPSRYATHAFALDIAQLRRVLTKPDSFHHSDRCTSSLPCYSSSEFRQSNARCLHRLAVLRRWSQKPVLSTHTPPCLQPLRL